MNYQLPVTMFKGIKNRDPTIRAMPFQNSSAFSPVPTSVEMSLHDIGHVWVSGESRVEWRISIFLFHARGASKGYVYLHSPAFESFGRKWKLQLSIPPLRMRNHLICLGLQLIDPLNSDASSGAFSLDFACGLRTSEGKILWRDTDTSTFKRANQVKSALPITLMDAETRGSEFLPSNTLTTTCRIRIGEGSATPDVEAEPKTDTPASTPAAMSLHDGIGDVWMSWKPGEQTVDWTISNFLSRATEFCNGYLQSPAFSSFGKKWKLQLQIPPLKIWHIRIHLGLQLIDTVNPKAFSGDSPLAFTCGLRTSDGEILEGNTDTATFERAHSVRFVLPIAFSDVETRGFEYQPSNSLTITCRLRIGEGSATPDVEAELETQVPGESLSDFDSVCNDESEQQTRSEASISAQECPCCKNQEYPNQSTVKTEEKETETEGNEVEKSRSLTKLEEDLKDLLLSEIETDVVLKVDGREFKAHRNIIRTRSPVLFAMFAHDTEEKRTGVVNIQDCDPDTFPDFLRYVYTGQVETLTEDKALHLYRTADKYQLMELKEQCLELLKKGMSLDNFCDVLSLSLQHNERELTEIATQFFVDNAIEIALTPRWQTFMAENVTTANELIIKGFRKGT